MTAIGGIYPRGSGCGQRPIKKMTDAFCDLGLSNTEVWPKEIPQTPASPRPVFGTFALPRSGSKAHAGAHYCDENSGMEIAADARIDDQETLLRLLDLPPDQAYTMAAGDLILHAYRKWGDTCPEYLIGDYAFAIWDPGKRRLFCARDHIGARSFFYQNTPDDFTFASDIRGVLAASEKPCPLNEDYLAHSLLSGNFYAKQQTYYEGVKKLPAGHSLSVDSDGLELRRYWDPRTVAPISYPDDASYAQALRDLLGKAVEDRIRTDESLGVHISGGLDSSAIAQIVVQQLHSQNRDQPLGLSWQPPVDQTQATGPEHRLIAALQQQTGLQVDYVVPDSDGLYAMFLRDGTREPCGRTLVNEDAIQQHAAANNLGVILSGWGGDQSISNNGRSYYPELLLSGRWITLFQELRLKGRRGFKALWSETIMPAFLPSVLNRYANWKIGKPKRTQQMQSYIHPDFQAKMKPERPESYSFRSVRKSQIQQMDDGLVTRRLEAWAANGRPLGIEYRYPLLDRRITEFALAIPSSQFKRGKWNRWIFRNAMRDILPQEICWNQSKAEHQRIDALLDPFFETIERIRQELQSGDLTTSRGHYVDIPRLIDCIEPSRLKAGQAYGSVQNTLKLLDLG